MADNIALDDLLKEDGADSGVTSLDDLVLADKQEPAAKPKKDPNRPLGRDMLPIEKTTAGALKLLDPANLFPNLPSTAFRAVKARQMEFDPGNPETWLSLLRPSDAASDKAAEYTRDIKKQFDAEDDSYLSPMLSTAGNIAGMANPSLTKTTKYLAKPVAKVADKIAEKFPRFKSVFDGGAKSTINPKLQEALDMQQGRMRNMGEGSLQGLATGYFGADEGGMQDLTQGASIAGQTGVQGAVMPNQLFGKTAARTYNMFSKDRVPYAEEQGYGMLSKAIEDAGSTPADLRAGIREGTTLSEQLNSPRTARIGQAALSHPEGRAYGEVFPALEGRDKSLLTGVKNRLSSIFDVGATSAKRDANSRLMDSMSAEYQALDKKLPVIDVVDALQKFPNSPKLQSAFKRAQEESSLAGNNDLLFKNAKVGDRGLRVRNDVIRQVNPEFKGKANGYTDFIDLHPATKNALRSNGRLGLTQAGTQSFQSGLGAAQREAKDSSRSNAKQDAAGFNTIRQALIEDIKKPSNDPQLDAMRAETASLMTPENAYNRGRFEDDIADIDPTDFRRRFDNMSPDEQEMYRLGFSENVLDDLNARRSNVNATQRQFDSNDKANANLTHMFGPEKSQEFKSIFDDATRQTETYNAISGRGASPTGFKAEAANALASGLDEYNRTVPTRALDMAYGMFGNDPSLNPYRQAASADVVGRGLLSPDPKVQGDVLSNLEAFGRNKATQDALAAHFGEIGVGRPFSQLVETTLNMGPGEFPVQGDSVFDAAAAYLAPFGLAGQKLAKSVWDTVWSPETGKTTISPVPIPRDGSFGSR